ncbi:hypothetical protein BYT27DRAFT_7192527 [Phlegmacium glaucopus]|nr:hypothetical protein BYT27DRAFT_7192527 [Phlegmacium glaucopus]
MSESLSRSFDNLKLNAAQSKKFQVALPISTLVAAFASTVMTFYRLAHRLFQQTLGRYRKVR